MMVPVLDILANCAKYADRTAIVIDGQAVSYTALAAAVVVQAERLAALLAPGERMALLCGNSLDFITLSLAAERAGVIRVPLNIKSTPSEIAALLEDCAAGLVIYEPATEKLLAAALEARAISAATLCGADWDGASASLTACGLPGTSDACSITYTSGSTGRPKGVVLSHGNWHHVFANMLIERDITAQDSLGFIGPLTHAGWSYLCAGLLRGARSVVFAVGDVEALVTYAAHEPITIVTCVPTTLSRILSLLTPDHALVRDLKWIGVGGAPTSPALLARVMEVLGRRIVLNFGQTEAMMTCTFYDFGREPDREDPASFIGRPYIFTEIAVVGPEGQRMPAGSIGEICIRGPHTMLGYWNQPEQTAKTIRDGYVLSGDLGVEVEPGLFRLVGRAKEIIISGGFNIYPQEVEAAVSTMPEMEEVAVLGLPSEEWGEEVVCVFATRNGAPVDAASLRAQLKPMLGIKTPKAFHQLPSLPKAGTGKIDKKVLRQWLETKA